MRDENLRFLLKEAQKLGVNLDQKTANQMFTFSDFMLEYNKNVNLTRIINENEIIVKHFLDSLSVAKYIKANSKIIDIGTGAGFPGIILKLYKQELNITLLDSLNKRITFLKKAAEMLELSKIEAIHARAQDLAKDGRHTEQYDYAISRAVANLDLLIQISLPYIKKSGLFIAMKGRNYLDEIKTAQPTLKKLNAHIVEIKEIKLPPDIIHNIILIRRNNS